MYSYQNSTMDIEPTFRGYMEDENDALLLLQATIDGSLRHIPRRPYEIERPHLIVSGNIFVFIEEISGIKRWTDGVSWSPSRISGKFLVYKEIDRDQTSSHSKRKATSGIKLPPLMFSVNGGSGTLQDLTSGKFGKSDDNFLSSNGLSQSTLIKKTISVCLRRSGSSSFENFHIVSYYTLDDIKHNRLITPKSSLFFRDVRPSPEVVTAMENTSLGNTKGQSKSDVKRNTPPVLSEVPSGIDISSLNGMGPDAYQRQIFDNSSVNMGSAEQFISVDGRADSRAFDYSSSFNSSGVLYNTGVYAPQQQQQQQLQLQQKTQPDPGFSANQTISTGYSIDYTQGSNIVAPSANKNTYYHSIPIYGQGNYSSEQTSNVSASRYAFPNGNSPSNSASSASINTSFSNPTPMSHIPSPFTAYSTRPNSAVYSNNNSSNRNNSNSNSNNISTLFVRNAKDSLLATDIGMTNGLATPHSLTPDQNITSNGVPLGYAGVVTPLPRKQQQSQDHYFAQQPQYITSQQDTVHSARQTPLPTSSTQGVHQSAQTPSVRTYHTQVPLLPQQGQLSATSTSSLFMYPSSVGVGGSSGAPNAMDVGAAIAAANTGLPSTIGSVRDGGFSDNPSPRTTTAVGQQIHAASPATAALGTPAATTTTPPNTGATGSSNYSGILTTGRMVHSGGINVGSRIGTLSRG